MPTIYLQDNERNQEIAAAVGRLVPSCTVMTKAPWISIASTTGIRIQRRQLEEKLGAPLSDDEWRQAFARKVGEELRYDDQVLDLEEYFGGHT
jgi:hypothetical protein